MERVTVGDLFDRIARGAGERDAFVFTDRDVRWSYREALARTNHLAKALIGVGIHQGDHVAVWATNWPERGQLQLALAKIGAVSVTGNPAYRADELAYVLEQSDVTTLFLIDGFRGTRYADLLAEICPEMSAARPGKLASRRLPRLKRVALFEGLEIPGMLTWSDVLRSGAG